MNGLSIRFTNSDNKWSESVFTDVAHRVSMTKVSGELPGVEFEDIVSGEGVLNKNIYAKKCTKLGKEFVEGDVLFGKLRPYLKNILLANFRGVAIGDFWVLRPQNVIPYILYTLVNSPKFMEVANLSSGSKMPRADWNLVSNSIFYIPTSRIEQQQIASYFKSLDSLIQEATKKISSLKQLKSASLQSMFPQVGETKPRIRFKGFEGEWKSSKASQIFMTRDQRNRPDLPILSACQDIRGMAPRSLSGYDISHDKSNEVIAVPLKSQNALLNI